MGEAGLVEMCVSVHSVTTFAYILESSKVAQNEILRQVDWLLHMFTVVPVDVDILQQALRSKVKDYEDAVVERAAILAGAECIVTRNAKDFKQSQVRAVLPKVFLSETK